MLVYCESIHDILGLKDSLRKNKQRTKAFRLYLQYIEDHCFHLKCKRRQETLKKDIFSSRIYIPLAHNN